MVRDSAREESNASPDATTTGAELITDLVADTAIPGITAPVRRNFLKALGQLPTAVVDIPAAYLTGKSDERRAETAARIKLIETSAEQIAQQMKTDPEYARLAAQKFGHRILREHVNLDRIVHNAANELRDASDSNVGSEEETARGSISEDWLNAFEREGKQTSTEEMQALFGKILAGEVRRPGSFSIRSIQILGSLDQAIANHFVTLCSASISIRCFAVMVSSLGGSAGNNALREYGLHFTALNLLNEYGLVTPQYNSRWNFTPCIAITGTSKRATFIPLSHQGKYWILAPISNASVGKALKIHGVSLTNAGRELSRVVTIKQMPNYSQALSEFFEKNGYRMIQVADPNPCELTLDDVMNSNWR